MQVHAWSSRALDERVYLPRRGDSDGVGQDDLVGFELGREPGDDAGVDPALERAAERNADRDCHRQLGALDHFRGRRAGFRQGLVGVAPAERLRRREREVDAVEAGCGKPLVPLDVQRQPRVLRSIPTLDRVHDILGAGHLRHRVGTYEARRLDPRQPCRAQAVDQLGANPRRERLGLVLQAVAGPDIADRHAHGYGAARESRSSTSPALAASARATSTSAGPNRRPFP